jgi:hypothetical protein
MSRSDQQLHAVQTRKMLQDHQFAPQNGNAKLFCKWQKMGDIEQQQHVLTGFVQNQFSPQPNYDNPNS